MTHCTNLPNRRGEGTGGSGSNAFPDQRLRTENQSYVIVANRVGTDDGLTFCGSSAIVDPDGVVLAAASADREELAVAEVLQEVLRSVREGMPVFAGRREELYALLAQTPGNW